MNIVVMGGTGLIGGQVVEKLRKAGHEVVAASQKTGVNLLTGQGLADVLRGADVVVDVTNSPSFEAKAVMDFFVTSGRNLAAAEAAAGVKHHVALSVVGTDRLPDSPYFLAKKAQETLIRGAGIPYTIVRATQFFEFVGAIAESGMADGRIHLSPALFQPIASEDVATFVADAAMAPAGNRTIEIAGPEKAPLDVMVGRYLKARKDARVIVADARAGYFGAQIDDRSLTPQADTRIGRIAFDEWIARPSA